VSREAQGFWIPGRSAFLEILVRRIHAALGFNLFGSGALAGELGFAGIMVAAAGIAKLLFYWFLVLFAISLVVGLLTRA
jgi:uncharacterized membrane protein YtjA (UPF0391 family)